MSLQNHRNKTGLYMAQGMYIPSQDKRAVVPPMLYRGHVVRIARGTEQNYYNNVVGRYPMHTINAGFLGSKLPLKDQTKYKIPHERRYHDKTHGKWTNFPMTVEMNRYAPNKRNTGLVKDSERSSRPQQAQQTEIINERPVYYNLYSRPTTTPVDRRMSTHTLSEMTIDPDANDLYDTLEPEITSLMAARNEVFQTYQQRIENALYHDSNQTKNLQSLPTSRLGAIEDYYKSENSRPQTSSFMVEDRHTNLLLPVPFVASTSRLSKFRSFSAPIKTK